MLRDYVQTRLDGEQIGDLLTMAGFELEGLETIDGDQVLDIKVVSNRGDGLSVFGLAREVLAKDPAGQATELYQRGCAGFSETRPAELSLDNSAASIESKDCLRFACRAFEGVDARGQSPEWMQKRLAQSGMRPISILVDLTNYVMLELGQPLHAFDRDKLAEGRIVVRQAAPGEKLTTLNGIEHELDGQMMICDADKPVGVPGVMGGLETEVSDATTNVLLESANFRNTVVRKTRKQLGLNTEASYRFERSVDPEGVVRAIARFTELLLESQPSAEVSNIVDRYPAKATPDPIFLSLSRAVRLLGMPIEREEAERYLSNLGFEFEVIEDPECAFQITPPSWRPDIVREDDLVEELGRIHGYEKIPEELPIGHTPVGGAHAELFLIDRLREALVRVGLAQIVSHSLRDVHPLDAAVDHIGPKNPASPEMAVLRNSILPCLADAAVRNGARDVHLFEMGRVFGRFGSSQLERSSLGILSTGALQPLGWQKSEGVSADFFSLKGAVESAFLDAGLRVELRPSEGSDSRFHPTRCADIQISGQSVGILGQIHPNSADTASLPHETTICEMDLDRVVQSASTEISYRPISRNPSIRRDISFEVDKSVPYAQIDAVISRACGDVLERHWLFDVYTGRGIGEGRRSLSVALQLRKLGENLTDDEANQVREKAVAALSDLGAKPR